MAAQPAAQTVKVSGAKMRGASLDGSYPLLKVEQDNVVIRHPVHGPVRVHKTFATLPEANKVTLSYDDLVKDIADRFAVMDRLMDGLITGRVRSFIVSGAPGVGKTYTIETKLAAAQKAGKINKYLVVRCTISPINLYALLWEYREKGDVVVLDDSDAILHDETGANIVKAATDSSDKRNLSYYKEVPMLENNGIPKSFLYEGSLVVATNIDMEREVSSKSKISVHLAAVLNRAIYVDLGLHSKQSLMAHVEYVSTRTDMLLKRGMSAEQVNSIVSWLKDNQSTVRSLSLRTALQLASMVLTDPNDWKRIAKTTLLSAAGR